MIWVTNTDKINAYVLREAGFIIDKPKETEAYTSEQIYRMGMVGVYKEENANPAWPTKLPFDWRLGILF